MIEILLNISLLKNLLYVLIPILLSISLFFFCRFRYESRWRIFWGWQIVGDLKSTFKDKHTRYLPLMLLTGIYILGINMVASTFNSTYIGFFADVAYGLHSYFFLCWSKINIGSLKARVSPFPNDVRKVGQKKQASKFVPVRPLAAGILACILAFQFSVVATGPKTYDYLNQSKPDSRLEPGMWGAWSILTIYSICCLIVSASEAFKGTKKINSSLDLAFRYRCYSVGLLALLEAVRAVYLLGGNIFYQITSSKAGQTLSVLLDFMVIPLMALIICVFNSLRPLEDKVNQFYKARRERWLKRAVIKLKPLYTWVHQVSYIAGKFEVYNEILPNQNASMILRAVFVELDDVRREFYRVARFIEAEQLNVQPEDLPPLTKTQSPRKTGQLFAFFLNSENLLEKIETYLEKPKPVGAVPPLPEMDIAQTARYYLKVWKEVEKALKEKETPEQIHTLHFSNG